MLKLKLQYFGHLMRRVDSLEKTLMLGGIGIYIYTHTQHIKHVNVSYSNKKTQSIINPISKEKKKEMEIFFFSSQMRLQERNRFAKYWCWKTK